MRSLLINLDTSPDRLEFQYKQLKRLGISFERISATSISEISSDQYEQKSLSWERPLRYSELACFLSHLKAWENVLNTNEAALILEDDALLSMETPKILNILSEQNSCKYDLVTLEVRGRKKIVDKKSKHLCGHSNLVKLYQDRTGAAGYILWPDGARKLIETYKHRGAALADAFISSTYSLNAFQVEPAAIIQLDQCEAYGITSSFKPNSTISMEIKPTHHYQNKLELVRFKIKRIQSQLKMAFRQVTIVSTSQRRFISLLKEDFRN